MKISSFERKCRKAARTALIEVKRSASSTDRGSTMISRMVDVLRCAG